MGTRLVPVENVEQMLAFWREGMLLFCMECSDRAADVSTYQQVDSHWTEGALIHEYETEVTWKRNEWRIRLED